LKKSYLVQRTERFVSRSIDVVCVGFGPIGRKVCCAVAERAGMRLVGAADIAPELAGKSVGAELGLDDLKSVRIVEGVAELPPGRDSSVAVLSTSSFLESVAGTVEELLRCGYNVVSSTEELTEPWSRRPGVARRLDTAAKHAGRTVLGTGINPGWVLDLLPVLLSLPCTNVKAVKAERILNASLRRGPLQKKIGSGMSAEEFERLADDGKIGHVGLVESALFAAGALGLEIDALQETLSPVMAAGDIRTEHVQVASGQVRGIDHRAQATRDGQAVVELRLVMALEEPEQYDRIELESDPPVEVTVRNGYFGDTGTVGILVNMIPPACGGPPGLLSPWELPCLGHAVSASRYLLREA